MPLLTPLRSAQWFFGAAVATPDCPVNSHTERGQHLSHRRVHNDMDPTVTRQPGVAGIRPSSWQSGAGDSPSNLRNPGRSRRRSHPARRAPKPAGSAPGPTRNASPHRCRDSRQATAEYGRASAAQPVRLHHRGDNVTGTGRHGEAERTRRRRRCRTVSGGVGHAAAGGERHTPAIQTGRPAHGPVSRTDRRRDPRFRRHPAHY